MTLYRSSWLGQCRYLLRTGEQCTGEVADPEGEVKLCTRHLARALEMLRRTGAMAE